MLVAAGCAPSHQLPTAPVSGTVTLDGKPVASGYVIALPSMGRMAKGAIQSDGSFVLSTYHKADGAQVGTHPLIVTPVPPDEGSGPRNVVPIPRRYAKASSSGLTIEVPKGGLDGFQIALTTGG